MAYMHENENKIWKKYSKQMPQSMKLILFPGR